MGMHVIEICSKDGILKERIHNKATRKSVDEFFEICRVGGWMFSNIYYLNGTIKIQGTRIQYGETTTMVGEFTKEEQSQKTSSHDFRTKKHRRESLVS